MSELFNGEKPARMVITAHTEGKQAPARVVEDMVRDALHGLQLVHPRYKFEVRVEEGR